MKIKFVKLQRVVGGEEPMTTNLDMGGYRILNIAQPRDPSKKKDFESDLLTAKTLYDYMANVDQNLMRSDRDGSLDGRLNMSNHRISGLADLTDADHAVTGRYVVTRFQALSDEVQDNRRKLDVLQNLLWVENNQVLLMKYELIDTGIRHGYDFADVPSFRKYTSVSDDIDTHEYFDIFTLKENFMLHLLEEPVDDITWLRIKQPGTYTIHFDLIFHFGSRQFSFELHTRDEIMHFTGLKPKHDINLEKDDNCLLVYKEIPRITNKGSKIYGHYNI